MVWGSSAGSMVCGVSAISVLLLEWCVSLACRSAGSAVQPAAVDRQDRSGYIGGLVGQEEGDHVRHLLGRAQPTAREGRGECVERLAGQGAQHRGVDGAGSDSVYPDPLGG